MNLLCVFDSWLNLQNKGDQATWLLVFVNIGFLIANILLWIATKNATKKTTDYFKLLNTPWVAVTDCYIIEGGITVGSPYLIIIKYKNFGNVSTKISSYLLKITFGEENVPILDNLFNNEVVPSTEMMCKISFKASDYKSMNEKLTVNLQLNYEGLDGETKVHTFETEFNFWEECSKLSEYKREKWKPSRNPI